MVGLTEPRCKVCKSPNRQKYEELRLKERKSLSQLQKIALDLGERISPSMFSRHFRKHVFEKLKEQLDLDVERKQLLEEKVGEAIDIVSDLRRCLRVLDDAVKPYMEKKEKLSLEELSALNATIRNIRETDKLLFDLTHQLEIKGESKSETEKLVRAAEKIDPQTARKVLEALGEEGLI